MNRKLLLYGLTCSTILFTSYYNVLNNIFPSEFNIKPNSNYEDILRRINKLKSMLKNCCKAIPGTMLPLKENIYDLITLLSRSLLSNNDENNEISKEISFSDLLDHNKYSKLYEYESIIKNLKIILSHSITFKNLADSLCEILGLEPLTHEITEDDINKLFNSLKENLDNYNLLQDQYLSYKTAFEQVILTFGDKAPSSVLSVLEKIKKL